MALADVLTTSPRSHEPPPVSSRLLVRERVLRTLDEARESRVLCLQAPGGYGKTTVAAQWVARDDRPVIWLSVRPPTADALWVARSLVAAIEDLGLDSGQVRLGGSVEVETWHLSTLPVIESLLSGLTRPLVLVIDDAGAVTGTPWECLLEAVATSLPDGCQLVLTTREAVPATLWKLQSRGDVAVIGPTDLAFDADETSQVLRSLGVAPPEARAGSVFSATEGWPIAVYLTGLAMKDSRVPVAWEPAAGGGRLTELLTSDIVSRLSADDAAFLLRTSVLSELDESSCDALVGSTGSLARLRRLATHDQLLVAQDEAAERFRMHPLLAEGLSERLHERHPQAWGAAHSAASRAAEHRGDLDGAVHHAKTAGDEDRIAHLVWSRAPFLLGSGQWAVLKRWLDGLDDERLVSSCGLALSAAWLASHVGDMARMNRFSLAATEAAAHQDPTCVLDADLLTATIGAHGLDHMETAARAFIHGKPADDPWQTLSHFLLGIGLFLRDEDEKATAALTESRRLSASFHLPVMEAHALAALADVAFTLGEEHKALSYIRESRERATRHRIDAVATTAPIFTTSAVGFVHEGRFADARREAVRALRLTALMRMVVPWHAVQGRLALAQVNLALGDPERARMMYDEAGDARGPLTVSTRLDRAYAETEGRLVSAATGLAGASSLTTAEVRVLQYLPTHLSFPQIADELFVSRHTVKTQALSAYRKLGVHSRTEAIERARRTGLLPPG